MAHDRGLTISLTLFHHSLPKWASVKSFGGWTNPHCVEYFVAFVRDIVPRVAEYVDHYVTINEPAVFANLYVPDM
jgi:beta-glucosidase/6-phospho-beta-glucosidase/beta-galactosidase